MDRKEWKKNFLNRLLNFSSDTIIMANNFPKTPAGFAIASQLIRSSSSIGANIYEAQDASSSKDFTNKVNISLREARETNYWFDIVEKTGLNSSEEISKLKEELNQIISILVSIVKKMKLSSHTTQVSARSQRTNIINSQDSSLKSQISGGFSLIELLVVMGIIGILATMAITVLNPIAQFQKANDAKRKSYINEIKTALEFIKIDSSTGTYPDEAVYNGVACNAAFIVGGTTYIQRMICDPTTNTKFVYTRMTPTTYTLSACLEYNRDSDINTITVATSTCPSTKQYQARNP